MNKSTWEFKTSLSLAMKMRIICNDAFNEAQQRTNLELFQGTYTFLVTVLKS